MIDEFNTNELIDFDIENEDIEDFDPMIHKMTTEISQLLDNKNKILESKLKKKKLIENLVVENNGIPYNGDDISQNRMAATGTIAHHLFIKSLGTTFRNVANDPNTVANIKSLFSEIEDDTAREQAELLASVIVVATYKGIADITDALYNEIYKNKKIGWKDAEDRVRMVQGKSVLESLYKSMVKVGEIIAKAEAGEL